MKKTFELKGIEEVKSRIEPSIVNAQITGVADETSAKGKYFLAVSMITLDGNREHKERFYFTTPRGEEISLQRIKTLLKGLLGEDKAEGNYNVEQLNTMLTGQKGRFKFVGEEYLYNGEIRLRTQLDYANFCENLSIIDSDSQLKFNEAKDIKRLPIPPSMKNAVTDKDELF